MNNPTHDKQSRVFEALCFGIKNRDTFGGVKAIAEIEQQSTRRAGVANNAPAANQ